MKLNKHENHTYVTLVIAAIAANSNLWGCLWPGGLPSPAWAHPALPTAWDAAPQDPHGHRRPHKQERQEGSPWQSLCTQFLWQAAGPLAALGGGGVSKDRLSLMYLSYINHHLVRLMFMCSPSKIDWDPLCHMVPTEVTFLKRSLPAGSLHSHGIFQNKGVSRLKAECERESTPGKKANLFHFFHFWVFLESFYGDLIWARKGWS